MKLRKIASWSIVVLLVVGSSFLGYKTWDTLQKKEVVNARTEHLPSLSFSQLDGGLLQLDSLRDLKELLVINYFNPGCDHCKSMVSEMFQEKSRLENVRWLMITSENIETTKPFADSMKLSELPMVTVACDTALLFAQTFEAVSVPSFYVYKTGNLVLKHRGECSVKYLLQ